MLDSLKTDKFLHAITFPVILLTLSFLVLRLSTVSAKTALLPVIGIGALILIIKLNPVWGLIFTFYDMCILGEQVSQVSWELAGIARFSDLEFLMIFAIGVLGGGLRYKGEYFKKAVLPIKILFIAIIVAVIHSFFYVNSYAEVLRPLRVIVYNLLLFVMPAYFKNLDDIKKGLKYVFAFVCLSTVISLTGFVSGNPLAMTPFNKEIINPAALIWIQMAKGFETFRIYGGIGNAGYSTPFNYFTTTFFFFSLLVVGLKKPKLYILMSLVGILLEVLSMSRSALGGTLLGYIIILFIGAAVLGKKTMPIIIISVFVFLMSIMIINFLNAEIFIIYTNRFMDMFYDLFLGERGTTAMRIGYFQNALDLMDAIGGDIYLGLGYRMIPGFYGTYFDIAQFVVLSFQRSGQELQTTSLDSGWGNVFWTMGLMGIFLFAWIINYYLIFSYRILKSGVSKMLRALSITTFAFFCVFPLVFIGSTIIYGKSIAAIIQFVLLISFLGLWADFELD